MEPPLIKDGFVAAGLAVLGLLELGLPAGAAGLRAAAPVPPMVPAAAGPIRINGSLDEEAWAGAAVFDDFMTVAPDFGRSPSERTEARILSDSRRLYIGLRCFDAAPGGIKSSLSRRDSIEADDWVKIILDMSGDRQSAYMLQVNPEGVQGDGREDPDGNQDLSLDLVWESRGRRTAEGYVVEIAVPFKSLRFPARSPFVIGVGFRRSISRKSERVSFPPYDPRGGSALSQLRSMALGGIARERNVEILPVATRLRRDLRGAGSWAREADRTELGLSAKVGITSEMTAEATLNPDFSHIESDARQLDLNVRSPIYYAEKRPFFLEGLEQFAVAGGLADDGLVYTRTVVDPTVGVKLTGKAGRRNSMAALLAMDSIPSPAGSSRGGAAGSVAIAILRDRFTLAQDGYLGAIATAREEGNGFSRAGGVDGRLRLGPVDTLEFQALASSSRGPGEAGERSGHSVGMKFVRLSRDYEVDAGIVDISRDFEARCGYIARTGLARVHLYADAKLYPATNWLQRILPWYWADHSVDHESGLFESLNYLGFSMIMPRQTRASIIAILGTEVYAGRRFPVSGFRTNIASQPWNTLGIVANFRRTRAIYYAGDPAFGGVEAAVSLGLTFQPAANVRSELTALAGRFDRTPGGDRVYRALILRSRTIVQVNRYLFLRAIVDHDRWAKTTGLDLLASFTWIPGTVIQAGYGSQYERAADGPDGDPSPFSRRWLETKKSIFFKASYLWRF